MTRSRGPSALGGGGWQGGTRGVIALCVGAVAVIGAVACGSGSSPTAASSSPTAASSPATTGSSSPTAASSPATTGSGLHLPVQLLGLNKNTSSVARGVASAFGRGLGAAARADFRGLHGAIYGDLSGPTIAVFAARWTSAAARRAASAAFDKSTAVRGVQGMGSTDGQSFPAGPQGGALECGHATSSGLKVIVCLWADPMTYGGVVYVLGSASSLSDAASKTNQVRSAIGA
jgi:hypothetical protein